ncbi:MULTISPECIES: hypothetical protein [unclassified Vibrio]|uniref:hypothetical protein n=1 Tax=unclassified Vibrio TaxID=2614977 RepID=UPI00296508AB|nr:MULTISPECIES: hypothetical protein [unclassified Vibrio]MDW1497587.1 hypothetical protein [Vibrio sp. YT-19(2023)]MDW1975374.1 hypothetical protein [Vibrio sp. Vb1980]
MNEQDAEPTCTVLNVTQDDWLLSSCRCGEIEVHGPYKTADEACKAATAKYGVTKLTSPMLIF